MRLAVFLLASILWTAAARADGSIAGTVRVDKVPPRPPAAKIGKDAVVCGKEAPPEAPVVGPDRGLANVVVAVRGLKPPKPPAPTPNASVDQVACRYIPHVQAVTVGTTLNVLNNDAVLHNVHGTLPGGSGQITVFNVAMPFKGQKLPQVLKKTGVMKLRCDAGHTWMSAYVHVFDHPWFAVTDEAGKFAIKDLPPGKYTLEYWHEPLEDKGKPKVKELQVEVVEGKPTVADMTFSL